MPLPAHIAEIKERHKTHNIANDVGVQAHACCAHIDRGTLLSVYDDQAVELERLRDALQDADSVIDKLADWNGTDLSELEEELPRYKAMQQALNPQA